MTKIYNIKYCNHCKILENIKYFSNTPKSGRRFSRSHLCEFTERDDILIYDPKVVYEDNEIVVQYCGFLQYSMRVILKNHEYNIMSLFRATERVVKNLSLTNPNVYINNHKNKKLNLFEHPHSWIYLTSSIDCKYWDEKMEHKDGWSIEFEDKKRKLQLEPIRGEKKSVFGADDIEMLKNGYMSMETLLGCVSKRELDYFNNRSYYLFIYYDNNEIDRCIVSY